MSRKLLPCPFCGSPARIEMLKASPPEIPHPWFVVKCTHATKPHFDRGDGCPVCPMATGDTAAEVVASWNTRAPAVTP